MAARDSILLIIKQAESIDYNTLLNRVSSNYGSLNSARAALSRTLKDLSAFGLVKRQGDNIFITDKGAAQLNLEMKSKLLTKLNQSINSKHRLFEVDGIVKNMHTLIERGKTDSDLLKAAKGSVGFYLRDLERLNEEINRQSAHLNYISKVLSSQINALSGLGFNDIKAVTLTGEGWREIERLFARAKGQEFSLQAKDKEFAESLARDFNKKLDRESLSLGPGECLKAAKRFQEAHAANLSRSGLPPLKVYAGNLVFKFTPSTAYVIGAGQELEKLFPKKK